MRSKNMRAIDLDLLKGAWWNVEGLNMCEFLLDGNAAAVIFTRSVIISQIFAVETRMALTSTITTGQGPFAR